VHTGDTIDLTVSPAAAGPGIVFVRKDLDNGEIVASWRHVVDTRFCTTLGNAQGQTVSTVEHLLAAFWALGIDNARVELTGPEVPILDGSSAPWISFLQGLGVMRYPTLAPVIEILKEIRIQENTSWIEVSPSAVFSVDVTAPLGAGEVAQSFSYRLGEGFENHVAPARTFSLLENVEKMRAQGLIRGGSLENAVVIDKGQVMNPDGLRFADECARHKVLDLIGDWSLGGRLILGAVKAHAPGHSLNHKLLRLVLEDASAWRFVHYGAAALQRPQQMLAV
jgi:UDP-3-O-[3-hydroxymyristoyl] N-acetylglucosamine deacetylase